MAFGIVSKGLGGNATSMILGRFRLGISVDIVVSGPTNKRMGGPLLSRAPWRPPAPWQNFDLIQITVRYKKAKWYKEFVVSSDIRDSMTFVIVALQRIIHRVEFVIGDFVKRVRSIFVKTDL